MSVLKEHVWLFSEAETYITSVWGLASF